LQRRVLAVMERRGIAASRLILRGRSDELGAHLEGYRDVDIALDPFPFTGSTTTFESLWMGVPVVTLAGDHMAARWGASILRAAGLDELITDSQAAYVATATALAGDRSRLAGLRSTLRERVAASPLCDGPRAARHFERSLRAVWRRFSREAI